MQLFRVALLTASSLLPFLPLAAGCGSNDVTSGAGGTGTGTGGGATTSGSGSGSSSGTGDFDAGAKITTIARSMSPDTVQPGMENTQCVTVNLNNPEGAYVRRIRADLSTGSHHMVVYTSSKTVEEPVPKNCQPFSGILNGEHPIFIAQQPHASLEFPADENGTPVGFEIPPNQMVKLEMHYIDTTKFPLSVMGKISLDTVPLSTKVTKSDLAFWGTTNINIPANGTGDTGVLYQHALAGTKTFALTTHQHHLGTEMLVWYGDSADDPNKMLVAEGKNWADPPVELFAPPLDFPKNGNSASSTKGLAFQCKWKNPTPNTVTFGEGFNDEMCFVWQYYFPSQGFQLCVNGFCNKTP
ncbi:MAG: hypothetical protein ACMG6S_04815 [Byssovorax sp.]